MDRLLEVGKGPKVSEYRSIQVRQQVNDIDVLLLVNDDTAIIIEDKIDTRDHSGTRSWVYATRIGRLLHVGMVQI